MAAHFAQFIHIESPSVYSGGPESATGGSDRPANVGERPGRPYNAISSESYSVYSQINPSGHKRLRTAAEVNFLGRFCTLLSERNVSSHLGSIDKQFAVAWLDRDTVIWGTKCNKLLAHNIITGSVRSIPLLQVPSNIKRPKENDNIYGRCGIHAVAINPSRTLLATGGENPNDITVYRLPDFQPVSIYLGHHDWVFGLNWLSDEHLASGGRDGRMSLWTVRPKGDMLCIHRRCTRNCVPAKNAKVRETSYCGYTQELLGLDPDGFIRQVDTGTWKVAAEWKLSDNAELICMNTRHHLVAAGTESNLVLLDTRAPTPVGCHPAPCVLHEHSDSEGLRSVRINSTIISCGGAYGTISFFDLIAGKWVTRDTNCRPARLRAGPAYNPNPTENQRLVQSQLEYEGRDYMNHCAVYCQDWDPSGKALIAGGGPLAIGLQGCYATLWS